MTIRSWGFLAMSRRCPRADLRPVTYVPSPRGTPLSVLASDSTTGWKSMAAVGTQVHVHYVSERCSAPAAILRFLERYASASCGGYSNAALFFAFA